MAVCTTFQLTPHSAISSSRVGRRSPAFHLPRRTASLSPSTSWSVRECPLSRSIAIFTSPIGAHGIKNTRSAATDGQWVKWA